MHEVSIALGMVNELARIANENNAKYITAVNLRIGRSSGIDVLVEFDEGANLLDLTGLSIFLEERLHCRVDVVPEDAIRKELKPFILREAAYYSLYCARQVHQRSQFLRLDKQFS